MRHRNGLLAVLCGAPLLLLFQIAAGQSQSQPKKAADEDEEIEAQPLAPPPATAAEKTERDRIGELYSPSSIEPRQRQRPLDESPQPGDPPPPGGGIFDRVGVPALPFAQTSLAILGDVVKSQPYLTPNRLMLYTEFSIRVGEVFRVKPGFNAAAGDTVLAVRAGGKARMPDGRVVTIEPMGVGKTLRAGGRYVLFLTFNNLSTRYNIMTAWELRSGRVVATSVISLSGDRRDEFVNMDAESFLSTVRAAARIAAGQPQSQPKKAGDEEEEIEAQPLAPPPATAAEKAERDMVGEIFISHSSKEPSQWRALDEPPQPTDPPRPPVMEGKPLPFPPLPFAETSVAILGDVVKVQPYLTPHRLMLYTEISIKVEEVFSAKPGFKVAVGDTLLAVRLGGTARMPDGRVVTLEPMSWRRTLRAGGRYVLFLTNSTVSTRYYVTTAWELRPGRVVATGGVTTGPRERFAELAKMDAESFLSAVRAAARSAAGQPQSQPKKAGDEDEEIEAQPLAPPPATAAEKAERDRIGELFSRSSKEPSQRRPLDEAPLPGDPPLPPGPMYDLPPLPSLPFAETSLAILGDVIKAQSYLTPNRLALYTEFSIRVEEVFRAKPGFKVAAGNTVLAVRSGGKARMPDGRVVEITPHGLGKPLRAGGRYVLFLTINSLGSRYDIITAWELRSGRVVATQVVGSIGPGRAEFVNMEAESFLSAVRAAAR